MYKSPPLATSNVPSSSQSNTYFLLNHLIPKSHFIFHRRICYSFMFSFVLLPPSKMISGENVTPVTPAQTQISITASVFSNYISSPCF